ncbi:hypothetical protein HOI83_02255 [Candidatus Uhrbacteria bacterium]|jgi:hypothetical protein|nr:hypothetical protein [Candidatus Uhrbacteria bacterium]
MENGPETIVSWFTSVFGENPSWDLLLLMTLVGLILALAFWGRAKIMAVVIASYVAITFMSVTSIVDWLQGALNIPDNIWGPAGIVLVITGAMFAIVQYSFGHLIRKEDSQFAKSVILAVSVVGMLAAFVFTQLPGELLQGFSPITMTILVGDLAIAVWVLAPILLVGLTED